MSVDRLLMDTLKPLGYPNGKAKYNQTADTYIVFAEDEELITKHFYRVYVVSNGNYNKLVSDVKSNLKEVGFARMFESETYDEDMDKYRRIMRFNYENKIKEEI